MNAVAAAAAANNAQVMAQSPQPVASSPSLSTATSPSTSVASLSLNAAAAAAGGAGTPVASPAVGHSQQSSISLSIPSPAHGTIGSVEPAQGAVAAQQPGSGLTPINGAGVAGAAADASALPQSITAELDAIVIALYGDASADATNKDPDPKAAKELIDLMFEADLFRRLLEQLRYLEFEARKFFTRIFEFALTQRRELSVPYVLRRRHMILQCIHAYDEKDVSIALSCDAILRACIACEPITELIFQTGSLPDAPTVPSPTAAAAQQQQQIATPSAAAAVAHANGAAQLADGPAHLDVTTPTNAASVPAQSISPNSTAAAALTPSSSSPAVPTGAIAAPLEGNMVTPFFRYLHLPTFINSHAFATFSLLLTAYPHLSAPYLRANYDSFFARYNLLLKSDNYLTKVQAFTFLGELLMERAHQEVMMRYVNDAEHLKLAMHALRGPKAIQLAVFGVLKVFVPNPFKSDAVLRILTQNKRNFLAFLEEFERDSEDETLCAHKAEMISSLMELPDSVPPLQKKTSLPSTAGAANLQGQQQQPPQQQQQLHQQEQQALHPQVAPGDELP